MRGILSAAPGHLAIRLLVGTHLLLLQAGLVLWLAPPTAPALRVLVALVPVIAVSALCAAIHGLVDQNRQNWWRRRHGR